MQRVFDWSKALTLFGLSMAVVAGIIGITWLLDWIENTFDLPDGLVGFVFLLLMVCIGIGVLGGLGVFG